MSRGRLFVITLLRPGAAGIPAPRPCNERNAYPLSLRYYSGWRLTGGLFLCVREEFLSMKDQGGLAEWASIRKSVRHAREETIDALESGRDVILEKDVQGTKTLREAYPEGVCVVLPPSVEEAQAEDLRQGTETPDQLGSETAVPLKISDLEDYDYVIINSDLDRAVEDCWRSLRESGPVSKRRTLE